MQCAEFVPELRREEPGNRLNYMGYALALALIQNAVAIFKRILSDGRYSP
jgi:hypothetical protein